MCVCLRVNSGTGNLRIEILPPGDCQDSGVNFFSMAFRSADLSQVTFYCWGGSRGRLVWIRGRKGVSSPVHPLSLCPRFQKSLVV